MADMKPDPEYLDRVHYSFRVDKLLYKAICSLALEDDRTLTYVIHEALRASPKVKRRLEKLAEENSNVSN